jgi:hypothetical protein
MIEIRPSVGHFASTAWGRNVTLVAAATFALVLALFGSIIGAVIATWVFFSEAWLALCFLRARLQADGDVLRYTPPLGPTKTVLRSMLRGLEIGRPVAWTIGRTKRIVFAGLRGQPLIVLDPAVWAWDDIERIASVIDVPLGAWQAPHSRGVVGHATRFAVAGLVVGALVSIAVSIAVAAVLLMGVAAQVK